METIVYIISLIVISALFTFAGIKDRKQNKNQKETRIPTEKESKMSYLAVGFVAVGISSLFANYLLKESNQSNRIWSICFLVISFTCMITAILFIILAFKEFHREQKEYNDKKNNQDGSHNPEIQ